jgi:hypothetical protein
MPERRQRLQFGVSGTPPSLQRTSFKLTMSHVRSTLSVQLHSLWCLALPTLSLPRPPTLAQPAGGRSASPLGTMFVVVASLPGTSAGQVFGRSNVYCQTPGLVTWSLLACRA